MRMPKKITGKNCFCRAARSGNKPDRRRKYVHPSTTEVERGWPLQVNLNPSTGFPATKILLAPRCSMICRPWSFKDWHLTHYQYRIFTRHAIRGVQGYPAGRAGGTAATPDPRSHRRHSQSAVHSSVWQVSKCALIITWVHPLTLGGVSVSCMSSVVINRQEQASSWAMSSPERL